MKLKLQLSLCLLVLACTEENTKLNYDTISIDIAEQATIGQGWNSETETFAASCIDGSEEYRKGSEGSIGLNSRYDLEELYSLLDFTDSPKDRVKVFEDSQAGWFILKNAFSGHRTSYAVHSKMKFGSYVFWPNAELSELGKKLSQLEEIEPGAFLKNCGNKFIVQTDIGAQFSAYFHIQYLSQKDHRRFASELRFPQSRSEFNEKIQAILKRYDLKAIFSVSAFQRGGQSSELAAVFGEQDNGKKAFRKSCPIREVDGCLKLMEELYDYLVKPDGFSSQVSSESGQETGEPYRHITAVYPSAGIFVGEDRNFDFDLFMARRSINQWIAENVKIKSRLDFYNSLDFNEDPQFLELKTRLEDAFQNNLKLTKHAISSCYDELYSESLSLEVAKCEQAVSSLESSFIPLFKKDLEAFEDSQALCREGYYDNGYGCVPNPCNDQYAFGDSWKVELADAAGEVTYSCQLGGKIELESVSCNSATHELGNLDSEDLSEMCIPKSCLDGQKLHGEVWSEPIEGGSKSLSCNYGVIEENGLVCSIGYENKSSSCEKIQPISCMTKEGVRIEELATHTFTECRLDKDKIHYHLLETSLRCQRNAKSSELVLVKVNKIGSCDPSGAHELF